MHKVFSAEARKMDSHKHDINWQHLLLSSWCQSQAVKKYRGCRVKMFTPRECYKFWSQQSLQKNRGAISIRASTFLNLWAKLNQSLKIGPGQVWAWGNYKHFHLSLLPARAFDLMKSKIFEFKPSLSYWEFRQAKPRAIGLFSKIQTSG